MRDANEALRAAADRLVAEHAHLPPGAVLRSFARSVRRALVAGLPPSQVAAHAEHSTREALSVRGSVPARRSALLLAGTNGQARVPRPRHRR